MRHRKNIAIAAAIVFAFAAVGTLLVSKSGVEAQTGGDGEQTSVQLVGEETTGKDKANWKPAVDPKPLSKDVRRGLDWLVETQLADGAWGQGDESSQMRGSAQNKLAKTGNVADTCMATLALVRSGSMPNGGQYRGSVNKGVKYVLSQIEASDKDSLFVTEVRGTRVQSKIGTYVDTFTSLMLLSEVKGHMPDARANERLEKGLAKVLRKIERNQQDNGTWANQGWAPVLTQGIAAKGLNRARQSGANVDDDTLRKVERFAVAQAEAPKSGGGRGRAGGDAGISLYNKAASTGALRDSVNTHKTDEKKLRAQAKQTKDMKVRNEAKAKLAANARAEGDAERVEGQLVAQLENPQFIAGFGSNGGEEFLSYLLVSESLVVKGGDKWKKWDRNITKLLARAQNGDGSWTGHHCITGRTFCTSAALLVLMADRAPVPVSTKLRRG